MYIIYSVVIGLLIFSSAGASNFIPKKFQRQGNQNHEQRYTHFQAEQIDSNQFIVIKEQEWKACHRRPANYYILARDDDSVSSFLENPNPVSDLQEMQDNQLLQGKVEKMPWSGDYWSYAKGVLGARYQNPDFASLFDWPSRYEYIQKNPLSAVLKQDGALAIQRLSPSEKYDLIIGDLRSTLTQSMWNAGKRYFDSMGKVEGWMGICHGWAPAAIMQDRPIHSVDVVSQNHEWKVHLLPADIKGLVSYSWATNDYETLYLGQRCNKKDPERDENGRLIDPECFDLNPSSWHIAVVNQLGIRKRSFIMDATYDYEVWNQPLINYSYKYFNVKTNTEVSSLEKALVLRENFDTDKFSKYRSQVSKYIVGISMTVGYVVETPADSRERDDLANDQTLWVTYKYDLELDEHKKIVGGEWYQVAHPDFIWAPRASAEPRSLLDSRLIQSEWIDENPLPPLWVKSARASSKNGAILNTITKELAIRATR